MFTDDELKWIGEVLNEDDRDPFEISKRYYYKKKIESERNTNKENVRKELDTLRRRTIEFSPQELLMLRNENERKRLGVDNYEGIYIIFNRNNDLFYVGKADKVFNRAYAHFVKNKGNSEIYVDYDCGDEFSIHLIPLSATTFSDLNELEDNAIRAYDSFPNGYNRMPGNVMDKPIFEKEEYQEVADLMLDRIKNTESFMSLKRTKDRKWYVINLLSEYGLPDNWGFANSFGTMIQNYQKANKGK
ncbi:GIY-YIG nuclease family protein [Peribacillus simplex]|uniref:Excinuclease ABC C subunit domain-containing protein n=1 Tax=Peribacillus simplex TaxID=1478 RepID=A0AAN2PF66_9BACI|nr:GIY-YIG nuclease family protein [Peribacillus simplex]CEG31462.1 excinuclease ABC C subunit domain-containing protein [Peribacillus simplex]